MTRLILRIVTATFCFAAASTTLAAEQAASEAPAAKLSKGCQITPHLLVERDGALCHPVSAEVECSANTPSELTVLVEGRNVLTQALNAGKTAVEFLLPAVERETQLPVAFRTPSGTFAEETVSLVPARTLTIYLLPHSHVDIGYTKLQSKVEADHLDFIKQAVEGASQPSARPPEAEFKWNVEVLWAVDSFLKQASPEEHAAFMNAAKRGIIGIDAFYCHELAGLCRPEELVQSLEYARRMRKDFALPIESAMVTDCPGLTWGAVPVLAQSGIRYLSLGPNSNHRIGYTREAWDNRPFWWVSPCGRHKVLCWQTDNSYHPAFNNVDELRAFLDTFDERGADYPYDVLYYRQCKGDNRGPDLALSDFVEDWNARFAYPKLVIATTTEAFRAFEERYGDAIPSAKGDFSPYWEDGAASSARETAVNRATAERLVQAETLWAMLNPGDFPADSFREAWRNVLLYDEHTWGARSYINSGSSYPPGSEGYDAQWRVKQAFAVDAEAQSRALLDEALAPRASSSDGLAAVDVFNTSSWPRADLVVLPKEWRLRGESVRDADDNALPAQRLATGQLAVLVKHVPPFGAARLTFHEGAPHQTGSAKAQGATLRNDFLEVLVDEGSGAIRHIEWKGRDIDLVGENGQLNSYHYVQGFDPKNAAPNDSVKLTVKDPGPLVASIAIESEAPGCNTLVREVRLIDGLCRVDLVNFVDKKAIPLDDLLKPEPQKEGYHFGFAFNIPDGQMHIDMPWSVVRPEADQLPGSCKNWLSAQRWVDISNQDFGVTWATVDAPLIEVGAMSPQPAAPSDKSVWRKTIEPSATLYSYVMNNYWTTNYRHDQPGPVTFRYAIAPHHRYNAAAAARFGIEQSQPLIPVPADENTPPVSSSLAPPLRSLGEEGSPTGIIITALRPLPNDNAYLVRLFNPSGKPEQLTLSWPDGKTAQAWESNLDGDRLKSITSPIDMLPFEMVNLRIQRSSE